MNSNNAEFINQCIDDLSDYFKRNLTENVRAMYRETMNVYSDNIVGLAVKELINDGEKMPKLRDVRIALQRHSGFAGGPIAYDKECDDRFPISILWDAFRLLERGGKDQFKDYCDRVHMPIADRKRVIAKFKRAYSMPEFVVGQNLKGD